MTDQFKISAAALISTFALVGLNPSCFSTAAFIGSVALFGFNLWIERQSHSELDTLKDQIKALQEKVNVIMIGKGMGR